MQEKLARMLGNVTGSLSMVSDLAEKQERSEYRDEDSALAKMWIALRMRETVALARELAGGNGITFADATDDHQWIHTDPERAASGPFGAPIAHGFLTLSLLIPMWSELFDVTDVKTKVN